MNNKMKNVIIIISLLVLLIIVSSILIINMINNNKENNDNENKVEPSKEVEITDNNLIVDLNKKINVILFGNENDDYNNKYIVEDANVLSEKVFSGNITDSEKLRVVLNSMYYSKKYENIETDLNNVASSLSIAPYDIPFIIGEIDGNSVKKEVNKIFGKELLNQDTDKSKCPYFVYDKNNNKYYVISSCGGVFSGSLLATYKNKYTLSGDEAYVYVNVAEVTNKFSSSGISYNIFNDYVGSFEKNSNIQYSDVENKVYKNIESFAKLNEIRNSIINESNYKQFGEYIFKFKKDNNGNYYFVNVTKNK